MAIMNPKTALEHEKISRFGGICDHAGLTSDSAYDMRNFRILSDGSLEKRCGFFRRYSFDSPIRGLWEGTVSGNTYLFVVAGNRIYRRGPKDGSPTAIYTMPTAEGNVTFAFYRENLYLFDGTTVLVFRPSSDSFSVAEGYTPLYGRNWHPTQLGEIYEPLNLIQSTIRIHYMNTNGSTTFNLPFTAEKIKSVKVGGSSTTLYTFTPYTSYFTIPVSLSAVNSVEVVMVLDPIFVRRDEVLQASNASLFLTPYHQTLMTFGGNHGYHVYRTAPVSNEMLQECLISCAGADPLYFSSDAVFAVGSSQHPILALCQLENQMLVFNDEHIWTIRYPDNSDEAEMLPIRSSLGCSSENGVLVCEEYPIVVSEGGILRLRFYDNNPNFCETASISRTIEEHFDSEFLQNVILFWHKAKNQLWVRNTEESSGLVWIYDFERKLWFCFDGIIANRFFEMNGSVGFSTDGGAICIFDEELNTDEGRAFSAYYQSHYLAFSTPEFAKRALRLSLCAQSNGGVLSAEVETERGKKVFSLPKSLSASPSFYDRRMSMGRFRFLQFRLSSADAARCRIYSFSIAANN